MKQEQEHLAGCTQRLIKMKPFIKTIILRLEIIFGKRTRAADERQNNAAIIAVRLRRVYCKKMTEHRPHDNHSSVASEPNWMISAAHWIEEEQQKKKILEKITANNSENYERIFLLVSEWRRRHCRRWRWRWQAMATMATQLSFSFPDGPFPSNAYEIRTDPVYRFFSSL